MKHFFKREDTGEIIEVDYQTMINRDPSGGIEIGIDGKIVSAVYQRPAEKKQPKQRAIEMNKSGMIVSDALGVGFGQVDAARQDCLSHGYDVTFKPDPMVPEFYQAHMTPETKASYLGHLHMHDRSSRNGSGHGLTPEQVLRSQSQVLSRFPNKNT